MPSGWKIRVRTNSSIVMPDIFSTRIATKSVDDPYCHRSPGWNASGDRGGALDRLRAASSDAPACAGLPPPGSPIGVTAIGERRRRRRRRQRQPRGVRQDVPHRHRTRRRAPAAQRIEHLLVRVRRQPLRNRIVEHELAVFPQHHQRGRDNRLGHRREREDRVLLHRLVRFLVAPALRLEVDDLALARDQRHRAGNLVRVDVVLDERVDAFEPLRRHADGLGLRERQVGLRRRGDESRNQHRRER